MLRNYLKIAWRIIVRNKTFSTINILGLTLGMASSLLIGLWVWDELSVDAYHLNGPFLYSVMERDFYDGRIEAGNSTPGPLADELKRQFPEIVYAAGFSPGTGLTFTVGKKVARERGRFAGAEPIGRQLRVPGGGFAGTYTVTGVVADPPANTHLTFNLLASYATRHAQGHQDSWDDYWDYTYLQLSPRADPEKVKRQLALYSERHLRRSGIRLAMQPFLDIHLHSNLTYEIEANGNARTVQFLGVLAGFILLIAFINYVNLATARSLARVREVGVRKTIGARRGQLIGQFMTEGAVTSASALGLSLMLVQLSLPWFAKLTGQPPTAGLGFDAVFWLMVAGLWLGSLIGSCLFPAVALSGFSPIGALRGQADGQGSGWLRKSLVVFQFSCSVALLIGVIVIGQQLLFLQRHDKGLVLDEVIALKTPDFNWQQDSLNRQKMGVFKQRLGQLAGVRAVTLSSVVPGLGIATIGGTSTGLLRPEKPDAVARATVYSYDTEPTFFDTYSIRFLAGAPYQAFDRRAARQNVVINEAALRMLNFPDARSAIGQEIAYASSPGYRMKIHGVVADFHIESLKEPTRPTLYFGTPALTNGYVSLKTETAQLPALLAQTGQIWKQLFPESPFEFWFLNEQFKRQYTAETQLSVVVSLFTGLAIFVACLGLFGLATFTAEQRTKEIGVRKVLGASIAGIVTLLSKDLLKLVLIAIVVASPVAWYAMHQWLQDFAYRIDMEWWVFAGAGLLAVGIALLTVSFQSVKAALMNPVESLRSE